ncbi:MAG TPA: alpha/beta fold hydrolase [Acidimicrobiia bacterium]|nr:alpha/beta fold hydrolase [Acidimicrobiia bacterium]
MAGPGASSGCLSGFESLAADRGVVRYDQVGGSKSEYVISSDLQRIARFVDELDAVRDALNLDRVHLYGYSWGSMLAVEYLLGGAVGVMSLTLASPWLSTPRYLGDVQALAAQLPGDAPATMRR